MVIFVGWEDLVTDSSKSHAILTMMSDGLAVMIQ
jgi:hypothetical protein